MVRKKELVKNMLDKVDDCKGELKEGDYLEIMNILKELY